MDPKKLTEMDPGKNIKMIMMRPMLNRFVPNGFPENT